MSSSTLRVIAVLLAIGALVLGYMGFKASQAPAPMTQQSGQQAPEPKRVPVLVAAQDIKPDSVIDNNHVTTIFIETRPTDSYSSIEQVSGRQTRLSIAAGELILTDHFHEISPLVSSIRDGERAIAVRVDEVTGAGGFVEPGDSVDVLLFLPAGREVGDDSSAQRILSDVRVLAYGNDIDTTDINVIRQKARVNKDNDDNPLPETEAESDDGEKPTGKKSKTAVLAVEEDDLSSLLLAESTGRLRLALVGKQQAQDQQDQLMVVKNRSMQGGSGTDIDRQLVTLDKYKPDTSTASAKPSPQPVSRSVSRRPPPPSPTRVTVHRGTQEATVTVDREN